MLGYLTKGDLLCKESLMGQSLQSNSQAIAWLASTTHSKKTDPQDLGYQLKAGKASSEWT